MFLHGWMYNKFSCIHTNKHWNKSSLNVSCCYCCWWSCKRQLTKTTTMSNLPNNPFRNHNKEQQLFCKNRRKKIKTNFSVCIHVFLFLLLYILFLFSCMGDCLCFYFSFLCCFQFAGKNQLFLCCVFYFFCFSLAIELMGFSFYFWIFCWNNVIYFYF